MQTDCRTPPLSWRSSCIRIIGLVLCLAVLLGPALWNGFALIFFDSGGYIERALDMTLLPGRSLFYGLFLWATSLGWRTFWGPVFVQSLCTVWIIHLVLRCHDLTSDIKLITVFCIGLGLLTGISWYTSQLMPDMLASLMVLGLWLLGFRWDRLSRIERCGLVILILLGLLSHMSSMALAIGLIGVAGCMWILQNNRQGGLKVFILPLVGVVVMGVLLMPILHYILVGKATFTPGGPVFIYGRLVQDGIAQRWLTDHCPVPGVKLCDLQGHMPSTADDFLWAGTSPFQNIGGWSGEADAELQFLVKESINAYPGAVVWTSLLSMAQQMGQVATGDGLDEYQEAARAVFTQRLPWTAISFIPARQQQGLITQSLFDVLNWVHVPVAQFSMLGLLLSIGWGLRNRRHELAGLAFFTLMALSGNAFICGALSNPHDRYQSRLVWLATFITGMAVLDAWRNRKQKQPCDNPHI